VALIRADRPRLLPGSNISWEWGEKSLGSYS